MNTFLLSFKSSKIFLIIALVCFELVAQKPKVWIISDVTKETLSFDNKKGHLGDPDDVSAIAGYLLMSNMFDTKAIVVGSAHHKELKYTPNSKEWADHFFGKAYKKDLPNLNKNIGGYQEKIPFIESSIKETAEIYKPKKKYRNLKKYSSVKALLKEVELSNDTLNVLCWGTLTEPAILVNHCIANGKEDVLKKIRFISNWTNSSFRVGNIEHPEAVPNCFNDAEACSYIKQKALEGIITFYECSAIGQYGLVEGSQIGTEFYNKFKVSALGKIFSEGKFLKGKQKVDDSDSATYWVLLNKWGVRLSDIASNGTNPVKTEQKNEKTFFNNAPKMRLEMLERARAASKDYLKTPPVFIPNVFPEKGLTDPHTIQKDGKLYVFCGHDESWDTQDTWRMDRWEIHSTTDLVHWQKETEILPTETYIGDKPNCWAGDITEKDGKYYWYFSNRNHDTGVMVADAPNGPFKDALGKPLLPKGIIGKGHPYDPEIFIEDGVYTMFFGSGHYYAVTLADDMISLASKPKPIKVVTKDGKDKLTADKSTLFKRNGIYYLIWGSNYAMANNLYGPYTYEGKFLAGGHNNIFQWKGQWYALMENKDIGLFYRGVSLKPIFFNDNGTIKIPENDQVYPYNGRLFAFENTRMGWHAISGTDLKWHQDGYISGNINGNAIIESAPWLITDLEKNKKLVFKIKNKSKATKARIILSSINATKGFFKRPEINWDDETKIEINIVPNSNVFKEYTIDLETYPQLKSMLKRIRIEPALGVKKGYWEIEYLNITSK
ncbi:family 43 glycosylhydrolase [Aestuariivivens sediminicola]|uniref:family 43 glycosylhydrolase n=1 Tax=Aestuariivivens sediminicola TaxID=2913560 RepID=UPI001F5A2CE1|nr:family 43 glycosylhydrolase [Aestuariivivens sediminicola]